MMFTVPRTLNFGEPRLSGGFGLLGPAPRPLALATYSVSPSALTRTLLGHQPTGIWPITLPPLLPWRSITPTALIPTSATYSMSPFGLKARPTGWMPLRRLSAPFRIDRSIRWSSLNVFGWRTEIVSLLPFAT